MISEPTDLSLTLEQLTGHRMPRPADAPTDMLKAIFSAHKKPLDQLSDEEIRLLVTQQDGFPYLLDLVWPQLEENPLLDCGMYPGDILSNLLRADESVWDDRPAYRARLKLLCNQALARPYYETTAFRETSGLTLELPSDQGGEWSAAGSRMGFKVEAPCRLKLSDGSVVEATALVKIGPSKGIVVDPDWDVIKPFYKQLVADGFGFSAISITGNDADLVDVVRDWSGD
jgi:hypothetical protein